MRMSGAPWARPALALLLCATLVLPGGSEAGRPSPGVKTTGSCTLCVIANLSLPGSPDFLGLNPFNGHLYVGYNQEAYSFLTVVDPSTTSIVGSLGIGGGPTSMVADAALGLLYIVDSFTGNVTVINAATETSVGSISTTGLRSSEAFDPADGDVYLSSIGPCYARCFAGQVMVYHGMGLVGTIQVGADPMEAAYDPIDQDIYVVNQLLMAGGPDNVSVVQGTTVIGSIPVGSQSAGIAFDPSSGLVYVPNRVSDNVSLLQGTSLIGTLSGEDQPIEVGADPTDGDVYVVDEGGSELTVCRGSDVLGNVSVGGGPYSLDAGEQVYVANGGTNNVSVINGSATVASIPVGQDPSAVLYDNANGNVFVADEGSNSLTVIETRTPHPSVTSGVSELPGYLLYLLLGVVAGAVLAVVAVWVYLLRRRKEEKQPRLSHPRNEGPGAASGP